MSAKKETTTNRIKKYIELEKNSIDQYICKACDPPKTISGKHKSNLLQHFRTQHKKIFDGPGYIPDSQMAMRRLKLLFALTEIVSVNGRPFNYLQDSGFLKALDKELEELNISGFPIHKSHLISEVKANVTYVAREIREKIKKELKHRLFSLLTDIGTANSKSFLGICAQFIKNDVVQIRTIGMVPLNKSHTAAYVKDTIVKCVEGYDINSLQIVSLTTDNASNMLATTRQLNNLAQIEQDQQNEIQQFDRSIYSDEQLNGLLNEIAQIEALNAIINDDENYEQLFENVVGEIGQRSNLITTIRCGCHLCQLIVKDAIKKSNVNNLLAVCNYVAKKLHNQNFIYEAAENNIKFKMPHLSCITRWDSELQMVFIRTKILI